MERLPALSLAAMPGRRNTTLELAVEIEKRGFRVFMRQAWVTRWRSVRRWPCDPHDNVWHQHHAHLLPTRSRFCEHGSVHPRNFRRAVQVRHWRQPCSGTEIEGDSAGKPLSDMRQFVERLHEAPRVGELPPLVLATLRQKMIRLAEEIGQGMVFANGARSHMEASLSVLSDETKASQDFFIGNMIPTCVNEDRAAAMAVNRKTLTPYAMLPNYRNYWKEAGFVEEMEGVEAALERGDRDGIQHFLTDRWLSDTTLFGSATEVRDGIEAWFDSGIKTPIVVPSSANGDRWLRSRRSLAFFNAGI